MSTPYPDSSYWPANYQGCTLTGSYVDLLGAPVSGTLTISARPVKLLDIAQLKTILPRAITITLDGTGSFTRVVPATDDPDISPEEWTYQVTENFIGGQTYDIEAPQGATVDITVAAPVPDSAGNPIVRGPRGLDGAIQTVQGLRPNEAGDVDISPKFFLIANSLGELNTDQLRAAARTSLGLGDAATQQLVTLLRKADNLAGLTDLNLARTNLGLADLAALKTVYGLDTLAKVLAGFGLGSAAGHNDSEYVHLVDSGWDTNASRTTPTVGPVISGGTAKATVSSASVRVIGSPDGGAPRTVYLTVYLTLTAAIGWVASTGNTTDTLMFQMRTPLRPTVEQGLGSSSPGRTCSFRVNPDGGVYLVAVGGTAAPASGESITCSGSFVI